MTPSTNQTSDASAATCSGQLTNATNTLNQTAYGLSVAGLATQAASTIAEAIGLTEADAANAVPVVGGAAAVPGFTVEDVGLYADAAGLAVSLAGVVVGGQAAIESVRA